MRDEKKVNYLTLILVSMMILFTALLVYGSQTQTLAVFQTDLTPFTYVEEVFDKNSLLEIEIRISDENWNEMIENAMVEQYVMADILINGERFSSVGIRPKGNSSLSMVASDETTDRYSFKVKFSEYVEDQSLYGLDKLVLNNMIGDATYMKEYLSFDLFSAMGIATPAYTFANITVNGEPFGLYLALEAMEESFIQRSFGSLSGNLYKPESDQMGGKMDVMNVPSFNGFDSNQQSIASNEIESEPSTSFEEEEEESPFQVSREQAGKIAPPMNENTQPPLFNQDSSQSDGEIIPKQGHPAATTQMDGKSSSGTNLIYTDDELSSYSAIFGQSVLKKTTEKDYQSVIEMMKNLNEGTNLETYLDVDEILRYFAANTFLVNLDSYAGRMKHNYYLYEENGQFQILPWDFNLSFGAFELTDASEAINFPIDVPVTDTMENSPFIIKLLEVDEYKERYHTYLRQVVETYIESGYYEETINRLHELIKESVATDATAFYSYDEYEAALPHLVQFGIDRAKSIRAQLDGEQPSESYGQVETSVDLAAMGNQNGMGSHRGDWLDVEFEIEQQPSDFIREKNEGIGDLNASNSVIDSDAKSKESDEKTGANQVESSVINSKSWQQHFMQMVAETPQLSTLTGEQIQQLVIQFKDQTIEMLTPEELELLQSYGLGQEAISMLLEVVNQRESDAARNKMNPTFNQDEASNLITKEQVQLLFICFCSGIIGWILIRCFKRRKFTS